MAVVPHLESISALATQSASSEHFSYGLRDFLDGFYANPQAAKLAEEPRRLSEILGDEGYADAYMAALAEHLARQYRFTAPPWSQNPDRCLTHPHFAFKTDEGRLFLLVESPTSFRIRNIFISAEGLTRV